jgi:hypothetical protein
LDFRKDVREKAARIEGLRGDGTEQPRVFVSHRAAFAAGAQASGRQGGDVAMRRQVLSRGRESVSAWELSLSTQRDDASVFAEGVSL